MYQLKLKHHFDSAHRLLNYKGACANLHGHRWEVEVEMEVSDLINDMVVDFKAIKGTINVLDHSYLNDMVDFNPTAENLIKYLYKKIAALRSFNKLKITLWESPEASITYTEE